MAAPVGGEARAEGILPRDGVKSVASRQPTARLKLIVFAVVIVAGLSAHTRQMRVGLWLDEAWVANSIVAPTFSRMFYYDRWVQSTPPLFLTLSRLVTSAFGRSEVSLRAVAWLAGAATVVIMAGILRRMFSEIPALIGTALLLTNYYAGSYAQQVKQYSTDLLASVVFFALIWKCLEGPELRPRFATLIWVGCACILLSYVSVFWLPGLVVAFFLSARDGASVLPNAPRRSGSREWISAGILAAIYGTCALATVLVFVKPNLAGGPSLVAAQEDRFIGSGGVLRSLGKFAQNVCGLLLPPVNASTRLISYVLGVIVLVGLVRCLVGLARGDRRSTRLAIAAVTSLFVGMLMSVARQYPLLVYQRYVIWMLPCLITLAIFGVEPVWRWCERESRGRLATADALVSCTGICLAAIGAGAFLQARRAAPPEDVRGAYALLRQQVQPNDTVYVHGGTTEQFEFYRNREQWSPERIYWGLTDWPCCPLNLQSRVTNPSARRLQTELDDLARIRGGRLWILLPGVEAGKWSSSRARLFRTVPALMEPAGWRTVNSTYLPGATLYEMAFTTTRAHTQSSTHRP